MAQTHLRRSLCLAVAVTVASSAAAQEPREGDWPIAAKDFSNRRYSELSEITTENVATPKVAWTFGTGVNRGHEAAPIVMGSTMYVVTPYPNYLYALDLTQWGEIKWKYEAKTPAAAQGEACCDSVNRGVAFSDGRVFMNTLDGRTIAIDAKPARRSGTVNWATSRSARRSPWRPL